MINALILAADSALRTLIAEPRASRPYPATGVTELQLNEAERRQSGALMRINHVGEVCAQALYTAQALSARWPGRSATPNLALVEPALRDIVAACPELEGIQAARVWAGWIDLTPDVVPVIDTLAALPGLTVATGLSGHGFGIGPAIGEMAAQLATGATPMVDPGAFRLARFQ